MYETRSILVVDDDRDLREFLTTLLAGEGYTVFSATDEEQALSLFRANTIDLVIVDLLMPRINGVSLLKAMKKDKPEVRSIIYSAILGHQDVSGHFGRLTELADAVLAKPMRSDAFLEQVRKLVAAPE